MRRTVLTIVISASLSYPVLADTKKPLANWTCADFTLTGVALLSVARPAYRAAIGETTAAAQAGG